MCYPSSGGIRVRGHLRCEIVEGHRYADDPEPSWYSGQSQYARTAGPDVSGSHSLGGSTSGNLYDSGIQERPSGAFRLPEQRPDAGAYAPVDPVTTTGSHARSGEAEARSAYDPVRVPVRGPEYPTVRPTAETAGAAYGAKPDLSAPVAEPTTLVPPVGGERFEPGRPGESVYRTRRPVSSFVVAVGMVVLMIPVLRLLFSATFTGSPTARAIVPAVLLTIGFALTGIGLFAVAGRPLTRDAWLRPPVAYLPAGLILLVAAGLAVA